MNGLPSNYNDKHRLCCLNCFQSISLQHSGVCLVTHRFSCSLGRSVVWRDKNGCVGGFETIAETHFSEVFLEPDVFLHAERFSRRYSTFIVYIAFPRHFLHVFLLRLLNMWALDIWGDSYAGIMQLSTYKGGERGGGGFKWYIIITIYVMRSLHRACWLVPWDRKQRMPLKN